MDNIFNNEDNIKVHAPVNFLRIINNIQHQLNIQSDSMVNITPYELYILLEKTMNKLNKLKYNKPSELFLYSIYILPYSQRASYGADDLIKRQ